jgi:hypothetical protein
VIEVMDLLLSEVGSSTKGNLAVLLFFYNKGDRGDLVRER